PAVATVSARALIGLRPPLFEVREMHEWVRAQYGTLFVRALGRLKAFEATLVQAKLDGVTRLETGETPWAITLHHRSATALTDAWRGVHARRADTQGPKALVRGDQTAGGLIMTMRHRGQGRDGLDALNEVGGAERASRFEQVQYLEYQFVYGGIFGCEA